MIAYCVCNIVTDKRYIGVTTTPLPKRWTAHLSRARRGTKTALCGKKLTTEHCAKLRARWTPERRAAQARRMAAVSAHVHQTFPRDENGRFFRPEEAA